MNDLLSFEAGVTDPVTGRPRWTGEVIDVESMSIAEDVFTGRGYYRNLVVRRVGGHLPTEPCCSRESRTFAGGCTFCGDPCL